MNGKERRAPLRDDQVISVLAPNNPKVEGTASHHIFELYRKAKTVGEFISAVRTTADERRAMGMPPRGGCGRSGLWWDLDRGFIQIDDANS
jgi:hypothetical protein